VSSAKIPVLIVGAGPTGLALACVLARRGAAWRIIDKASEYVRGSRGKGLQPRSLEVLEDLGAIDRILANGRFHLPFRGYDGATVLGDHDMHADRFPTPDVPYASPLIIPQWRVEQILRERLAEYGGRVETLDRTDRLRAEWRWRDRHAGPPGRDAAARCRIHGGRRRRPQLRS